MDTKKIYRAIAQQYGVRVSDVMRDMQAAIDEAYKNSNSAALAVSRKGAVPTVEEFINYNVRMICRNILE